VVNPQKDQATSDKKKRRQEREAQLGALQRALPDKRYGVIYADPEWRFEPYSRETGLEKAADNHYPTSPLDDIKARPVADIAADDSVLFLWATAPMLPQALEVMAAWGFVYKSHVIWHKQRAGEQHGTGYWFLGEHELLLVGTRGNVPAPAPGTQWRSYVTAPVEEHSVKPDIFALLIEAYFPNLPKIELNARRSREGWDSWGYEAPDDSRGARVPRTLLRRRLRRGLPQAAPKGEGSPGQQPDSLTPRSPSKGSRSRSRTRSSPPAMR
jgi:N6-adenosine-specific RNA methylase IME4